MHLLRLRLQCRSLALIATACTLVSRLLASPVPAPAPMPQQKTSQVTINQSNAADTGPFDIPITAHIFRGSPGPKTCRGQSIRSLNLPKPGTAHAETLCYDLAEPASCAVFMATQEDGCEARLFSEPGCREDMFVNLAVFIPEYRAFGGYFRSLAIRCGVKAVQPPPLGLQDLEQRVPGLVAGG